MKLTLRTYYVKAKLFIFFTIKISYDMIIIDSAVFHI